MEQFRNLGGGLSEDRIEMHFDPGSLEILDRLVEDLVQEGARHAWLIDRTGEWFVKGGDPPSDLTFRMRKLAAESWPELADSEEILGLSTPDRVALVPLRPAGVLVCVFGREEPRDPLKSLLFRARELIEPVWMKGVWIVPPPVVTVIHVSEPGDPPNRA